MANIPTGGITIDNLPSALGVNDGDAVIISRDGKTYQTTALSNQVSQVMLNSNAGSHNRSRGGKYLGSSVTTAQKNAISDGTFDDIYVEDYWTINSVNWRVAHCDYEIRTGSSASLTTHHIVIVPDTRLYTAPMNATNTTAGAYVGSAMYTCEEITVDGTTYTGLAQAIETIESIFGDCLLEHETYLNNATTSGYPSGGEWVTRKVDLMNEHMLYGAPVRQQMPYGGTSVTTTRVEKSQLALFACNPYYMNIRATYWLRDVASSSTFALCNSTGLAFSNSASLVYGVRPYFLIS